MTYQSVNPSDGTILKTFEELTDNQLDSARQRRDLLRRWEAHDVRRASGRGGKGGCS